MAAAGVPIVPGRHRAGDARRRGADRIAEEIGYPVAIKAAAGGGGKGIRVVRDPADSRPPTSPRGARARPTSATTPCISSGTWTTPATSRCRCWPTRTATCVHLGERDCTHPAPPPEDRRGDALAGGRRRSCAERIGAIAVDAARAVGYTGAGTVEGLLAADGSWYFLEMNTRLQVEHTVTEMVTGPRPRARADAGSRRAGRWAGRKSEVRSYGHSIQCRINAEDATAGFVPAPGSVTRYREPSGPGVRVDSGVVEGSDDLGAVRPDGGQADRVGRGPRPGPAADAAGAGRVRGGGRARR